MTMSHTYFTPAVNSTDEHNILNQSIKKTSYRINLNKLIYQWNSNSLQFLNMCHGRVYHVCSWLALTSTQKTITKQKKKLSRTKIMQDYFYTILSLTNKRNKNNPYSYSLKTLKSRATRRVRLSD
ncbi:hypothetical protein PUN28_017463 [Cardiocondyla obscurior]|uniref:Uncharacterized protein n=1 Tax=Cardiocondyla obscurior TaxID=286306 RepID=A0AAW2EK54_9HYME